MICPEPSALQELVRDLHRQATPWLPSGLSSRLQWSDPVQPAPGESEPLVVSTRRLDQLLEHRRGDFTVTVQAGLPLAQLQAALAEANQWLALDWPWGSGAQGQGSGSVGGLVARGLAGGLRQRHLGVRDQVIGLSLLRADGTVARAGGQVVKNVAGYDLMRLLCGSWGSLGLITDVTLRTLPRPRHRSGLLLQGPAEALEPLRRLCLGAALAPQRLDWSTSCLAHRQHPAPLPAHATHRRAPPPAPPAYLGAPPTHSARSATVRSDAPLGAQYGATGTHRWNTLSPDLIVRVAVRGVRGRRVTVSTNLCEAIGGDVQAATQSRPPGSP